MTATYGLTCISEILKKKDKTLAFKTLTKSRFIELEKRKEKWGEQTLSERIIHNLKLTSTIIEHCRQNEIGHYRLSSSLFPLITDKSLELNLKAIADRFYDGMVRCNDSVLKRLVIENDDKGCWNCMNLFVYFHQYMGHQHRHIMPLTYDNLHDKCNPSMLQTTTVTMEQNIDAFAKTWPDNVTPVFHWSNGKPDNKRSHADFADGNPPEYDRPLIWEVEVKQKDFAIAKLQGKTVTSKKKAVPKTSKTKPSVKKILQKIEKAAPKSTTFNHLYGQ